MAEMVTAKIRLAAVFMGTAVFPAAVAGLGLWGTNRIMDHADYVREHYIRRVRDLAAAEKTLLNARVELSRAAMADAPEKVRLALQAASGELSLAEKRWRGYRAAVARAEENRLAGKFEATHDRLVQEGLEPAATALKEGRFDDAKLMLLGKVPALYAEFEKAVEKQIDFQFVGAADEFASARQFYGSLCMAFAGLTLCAALMAAVLGAWAARRLARAAAEPTQGQDEEIEGLASVSMLKRGERSRMVDETDRTEGLAISAKRSNGILADAQAGPEMAPSRRENGLHERNRPLEGAEMPAAAQEGAVDEGAPAGEANACDGRKVLPMKAHVTRRRDTSIEVPAFLKVKKPEINNPETGAGA